MEEVGRDPVPQLNSWSVLFSKAKSSGVNVGEAKKPIRGLTIYLIRPGVTAPGAVISDKGCKPPVNLAIEGAELAVLRIRRSPPQVPKWAKLFEGTLSEELTKDLAAPSVAGVLFLLIGGRGFAITFGTAGRFLLQDDVWEERFGLLTALKCVDPKSLRSVDVQSLDAIQSQSRIQSGQEASSEEFGLNVEQDLLKAIVGAPMDHALGVRMAGGDGLTVNVRAGLEDLPPLLRAYLSKHEEPLVPGVHDWVNNIAPVKSSGLISSLESEIEKKLAAGNSDGVWLAIPEIIDWGTVDGFMFSGDKATIRPDITFAGFVESLKGKAPTLQLMRDRSVQAVNSDGEPHGRKWKVFRCLYAEIDHQGEKYILNDGKWYAVAMEFVSRTRSDYAKIPYSSLAVPPYRGGGEGAYNKEAAESNQRQFLLLDANPILHGGGQGKVEVCDLLSADRELIHIKHYSKSSVLSHLFAQGYVSAQLILTDEDFRQKVRDKLAPPFNEMFDRANPPAAGTFKVVFGIISEAQGQELRLPFFSQVNLNNTVRVLRGYGFKVELLKIHVDPSVTSKLAPKKPRARVKKATPVVA